MPLPPIEQKDLPVNKTIEDIKKETPASESLETPWLLWGIAMTVSVTIVCAFSCGIFHYFKPSAADDPQIPRPTDAWGKGMQSYSFDFTQAPNTDHSTLGCIKPGFVFPGSYEIGEQPDSPVTVERREVEVSIEEIKNLQHLMDLKRAEETAEAGAGAAEAAEPSEAIEVAEEDMVDAKESIKKTLDEFIQEVHLSGDVQGGGGGFSEQTMPQSPHDMSEQYES